MQTEEQMEMQRERQRRYVERHPERAKAIGRKKQRKYYHRHVNKDPLKFKAQNILNKSKQRGEITMPDYCCGCGQAGRLHAHHDDYACPKDVLWLCPLCHKARHRELENGD